MDICKIINVHARYEINVENFFIECYLMKLTLCPRGAVENSQADRYAIARECKRRARPRVQDGDARVQPRARVNSLGQRK